MSDEGRVDPEFSEAEAPTERDPRVHSAAHGREGFTGMPPRGAALSVLWWLEGEPDVRG